MAFRKVSAKEWKKMGLPTSISTISFGLSKLRKRSTKKEIKDSKKKIIISGILSRF